MYNLTNLTNQTSFIGHMVELNTLSSGVLGVGILMSVFLVFMFAFLKRLDDFVSSLLGASAISSIVAVLFWGAGLLSVYIVIFPVIIMFASIVILKISD